MRPFPNRPPEPTAICDWMQLVARAERVGGRVQERDQALPLVVLEDEEPGDRHERDDTATAATDSQRRLAPDMKSVPKRMAPNTSDVPRSGWMSTSTRGGTDQQAGADDRPEARELVRAGRR